MSPRRDSPAHVLIVDDEPDVCAVLADALGELGLDVAGATSGSDAIEAAFRHRPNLLIADLRLGDCSGLEVVDRLREELGDVPVVFITAYGDPAALSEASRRRPVELINKPVDLDRLRETVQAELQRQEQSWRVQQRNRRLRQMARSISRRRRRSFNVLTSACADLTATCRSLQSQADRQQDLIEYQKDLLTCTSEDDVFRLLFRLFVRRSGPLFGVCLLCDGDAELQMVGRFGVPCPDGVNFSQALAMAPVPGILEQTQVTVLDAMEHIDIFPEPLHRMLVGVTLMTVPLPISDDRLIGMVVLYRKGEQPFTADDVAIAQMIAPATAAAVQKA